MPNADTLVVNDGFDELEKEYAIGFYAGKSWQDVLKHLRNLKNEPVFGAAYYLEEWSVLSKSALSYYIRAHLEFLIDQLSNADPDELFVHSFVAQLYQVAHIYKGSPFNQDETTFLKKVAEAIVRDARDKPHYGDYGVFIEDWVEKFFSAIG